MFEGEADYRIRPDGLRVLLTPITWAEEYGVPGTRVLTAPEGMVHDGASIPSPLAFLNGPSVQLAATLHDAAYRFHAWDGPDGPGSGEPMTRREADLIIRLAAAVSQERAREETPEPKKTFLQFTHWAQRWIIFLTLVPLGGRAWRNGPPKRSYFDNDALADILRILTSLRLTKSTTKETEAEPVVASGSTG